MKKILSIVLAVLVFALALLPVSAFAEEYNWQMSDDGITLTNNNTVYTKYNTFANLLFFAAGDIKLYPLRHESEDYNYDYIAVPNTTSEIVVRHYTNETYVTEKGKEILDAFIKGEYSFYIYDCSSYNGYVADFKESDFSLFVKEENKVEIDVTTIWSENIHYVFGFDKTGNFAHQCGAVYEINGESYFIYFDELDNSYFDANGEFSYRRGIVSAYKCDSGAIAFLSEAKKSTKERVSEYIYTDEQTFIDQEDDFAAGLFFWIISILVGIIIPGVPFVLSIIFANSKKANKPKRWYLLTLVSLLWMLACVGLVLTIIL